jgi:tetratricopeptide (TPR) repeat protein
MNISKALKEARQLVAEDVIAMCNTAKQLEDSGNYIDATRAMDKWWQGIGVRPDVDHLPANKKASILSRIGALSGWIGSTQQIAGSQEKAKDLISEAANLFEAIKDHHNWAETRSDLAVCYWREGAFDEARVVLDDVLIHNFKLSPELEGKILLRSLNVEISTCHYSRALDFINRAAPLIEKYGNDLLLGKFYFHQALVFHNRGEDENKPNYVNLAIRGYFQATAHYKKASHERYMAMTENNTGNAHRLLGDFTNAHLHLDEALKMYSELKDKGRAALVYDNKARVFIAQNQLRDAELAAFTSVNMLKEGGEHATLAESLTTLGMVLSRGGNVDDAVRTFIEAKETALIVGDKESAGNAVLTYIEELQSELTPVVFRSLYLEADELLSDSPKISTFNRLQSIARKQFEAGNSESFLKNEKYFSWKNFSLPDAIHAYERGLILKALNETGGRMTKAAVLLGVSHQSLSMILHQRHMDLQQYRISRKPRNSLKKS